MHTFLYLSILKLVLKCTNSECKSSRNLIGKTALVVGGNTGVGYETASYLLTRGCKVIIADSKNTDVSIVKMMHDTLNTNISGKPINLASLASVRKFAEEFKKEETRLDILIHCAGGFLGCGTERTVDGLLKIMQINYLGPFLLTHLLADLLKTTDDARVISVTNSHWVQFFEFPDMRNINLHRTLIRNEMTRNISIYRKSVACNVVVTKPFAQKFKKHGVTYNLASVGLTDTAMWSNLANEIKTRYPTTMLFARIMPAVLLIYGKTPREGAQTVLHCALSSEADYVTGSSFYECQETLMPGFALVRRHQKETWELTEDLVELREHEKLK